MHKRTAGIVFIAIAAFLYGIRYLSAAIFGSNVSSWDADLFRQMLAYVGKGPLVLSVLSLLIGILYLLFAEFGEPAKKTSKPLRDKIRENWHREN
ncbi:hypothetical protein [Paenibacillus spongiae]|uniref:Uncharacterized protein n=1 Tax=Paenibacillus spongiae TaxID=2909671 RepID=A0ABY5S6S6_9BACL|nr:hypothetical protein [Paenibacillus spongiae]UVI29369.1 hypothetical protein L1F29_28755 [Paenibacillus spongiae]